MLLFSALLGFDYPDTPTVKRNARARLEAEADPFRWLEDYEHPDVVEWRMEQGHFTRGWLGSRRSDAFLDQLRSAQAVRSLNLLPTSVAGDKLLFARVDTEPAQRTRVFIVDRKTRQARAVQHPMEQPLCTAMLSDDGRYLVHGTSKFTTPNTCHMRVLDLESDTWMMDKVVKRGAGGLAWLHDDSRFVFAHKRAGRWHVFIHQPGSVQSHDIDLAVLPDDDIPELVSVHPAEGWLTIVATSFVESRVWTIDLGSGTLDEVYRVSEPVSYVGRTDALLLRSGDRIVTPAGLGVDPVVHHDLRGSDEPLREARVLDGDLALIRLAGGQTVVDLPDERVVLGTGRMGRTVVSEDELVYTWETFAPQSIQSLRRGRIDTWVPGDDSDYVTERVLVTSPDGTQVPVVLGYRPGTEPDGQRPTLLYGYGGFANVRLPFYSPILRWLVDHGGVVAIAQVRGGAEFGEDWHAAAQGADKQRSFDDFIAAAEWLTGDGGWTRPDRLASWGQSNGGLLVAAAMLQHPEQFGAVIAEAGVHDMLRFPQLGGRYWTDEYGDPRNVDDFRYLRHWSPVHNASGLTFPPTLLVTTEFDERVAPSHSYKLTAALQSSGSDDAGPALLYPIDGEAHLAFAHPDDRLMYQSDVIVFLVKALGL